MRRLSLFLTLATLTLCAHDSAAQEIVKPYFVTIMDVSGSMLDPTGASCTGTGSCPNPRGGTGVCTDFGGPNFCVYNNSCGQTNNRINDAKCAFSHIVSTYGDALFGLMRFTQTACTNCSQACEGAIDC